MSVELLVAIDRLAESGHTRYVDVFIVIIASHVLPGGVTSPPGGFRNTTHPAQCCSLSLGCLPRSIHSCVLVHVHLLRVLLLVLSVVHLVKKVPEPGSDCL